MSYQTFFLLLHHPFLPFFIQCPIHGLYVGGKPTTFKANFPARLRQHHHYIFSVSAMGNTTEKKAQQMKEEKEKKAEEEEEAEEGKGKRRRREITFHWE